jgi:hypothetical protein
MVKPRLAPNNVHLGAPAGAFLEPNGPHHESYGPGGNPRDGRTRPNAHHAYAGGVGLDPSGLLRADAPASMQPGRLG